MSNEALFLVATVVDLLVVLVAWRLGRVFLVGTIVMNVLLVSTFAAKLVPIFGLVTNASNVFYASIFIATDILTEHHGKREGYRSVWVAFLSLLGFVALGQLLLQFSHIDDSAAVSNAMHTLFAAVPRIAVASFVAYAIAQSIDIWLFHFVGTKTGRRRFLWFRNTGSTLVSQFVDSVVFFSLAFAGTVPLIALLNIILTGYLLKLIIAVLDTPFIYLSYWVRGLTPPDFLRDDQALVDTDPSDDATWGNSE